MEVRRTVGTVWLGPLFFLGACSLFTDLSGFSGGAAMDGGSSGTGETGASDAP